LAIARAAARLFIERGVAAASGEEVARTAGVSTRTVWRHFRNKESLAAPLFAVAIARFERVMRLWPLHMSLEDHLHATLPLNWESAQTIADGTTAVQLVALSAREPDLRTVWLDAYHLLENGLRQIVADRSNRAVADFGVRLCTATIVAAVRVVDESVSLAAVTGGERFSPDELATIMARSIRDAATLPICDPISPELFGAQATQRRGS
jgi:AcrR family transcriptional regulator